MTTPVYVWLGFGLFVLAMMVLDLGVFHRKAHTIKMREAAVWTAVWVSLALVFNGVIYFWLGPVRAVEFLTGYVIEWSLSMDNVFVFAVIFSYFAVPPQYQHRVLFWGIFGAVVMRLVFILAGAALLERFHWLIYPMGGFLVLTGVKLFLDRGKESDIEKNLVLRLARRWFPITDEYVGQKFFVRRPATVVEPIAARPGDGDGRQFFVRQAARWFVTPLFLVLLVVETTDVAFAVDSIPAIFAVTRDPFIVLTSNVFAILGLRALYFLLAGAMGMFRYLSGGLAVILCFVGTKMLISGFYDIPIGLSLGVVCGLLALAVAASLLVTRLESGRVVSQRNDGDERVDVEEEQVEVKV
ncbi:MAG: TerC family protein [Planctomycetes bacterium]|nr:TerC family protein [Planctomycetota bacterium]